MEKTSMFGKVAAGIAAAALASTMMAGVAFADASVDGTTPIAPGDGATSGTGQTGIYLQVTDDGAISVTVPTSIYLAADRDGSKSVDFTVPTNAKIENLGMAVDIDGWDVSATNGMSKAAFDAATPAPAADKFWLQGSVDAGTTWEDLAANHDKESLKYADLTLWTMDKFGSTTAATSLNLKLQGQISNPTTSKYVDTPLIDTVTWNVKKHA